MAGKKKTAAKPKKPKAGRKQTREAPGAGHNIEALGEKAVAVVERYFALQKSMDSDMAGYKADFAKLYEEEGGNLGIKSSVLQKELKRLLAKQRAEDREKELKKDEREQTILFRSCFAGTPFEALAEGDLAAPDETEEATEEDLENAENG